MFWDISIAVGASVTQLTTAYLGWRMTVNPIIPKDPTQKRKRTIYEGLFIFSGLIGVFLVGLAAYRAPRERAHLAIIPDATYGEPGKPPSWSGGAAFLQVNKILAFNLIYRNVGAGSALNVTLHKYVLIEP